MAKKLETRLAAAGRGKSSGLKLPNPALERASTVLMERAEHLYEPGRQAYGRMGLSAEAALCDALKALYHDAAWCGLAPSGLAACAFAIRAFCKAGDHILITDSAYGPARSFCLNQLTPMGVEVEFYDPLIGGGIDNLIRENTAVIYLESPGSLTLEIQDVPAICAAAQAHGVPTLMDDTWSAGILCDMFELGCDIAIQALTKYTGGHSDLLLGCIVAKDEAHGKKIEDTLRAYGVAGGPENAWLALRGLRSLPARMRQHEESGLTVARWLAGRPEIGRMTHPALESHPDHALWLRDFTGSNGLFAFELKMDETKTLAFLNALELFGLGFSWGGFESLAIHCNPQIRRDVLPWQGEGSLIRVSIGLEAAEDLIADLDQALNQIA